MNLIERIVWKCVQGALVQRNRCTYLRSQSRFGDLSMIEGKGKGRKWKIINSLLHFIFRSYIGVKLVRSKFELLVSGRFFLFFGIFWM